MDKARHIHGELADLHETVAAASIPARGLIALVRLYQVTLGPMIGGQCRFSPSCSFYAIEALARHGAIRGGWFTVRRLVRCQPWGGSGDDPVPV
jgi:hypothetical protein